MMQPCLVYPRLISLVAPRAGIGDRAGVQRGVQVDGLQRVVQGRLLTREALAVVVLRVLFAPWVAQCGAIGKAYSTRAEGRGLRAGWLSAMLLKSGTPPGTRAVD